MDYKEFWESRERWKREMDEEFVRVACILDEKGYAIADHVNYELAKQWVKIEMPPADNGRIYSWYIGVNDRGNFRAVLRWILEKTKFGQVTGFAEDRKRIPTFYSVWDLDMYYDEYFG